MQQQPDGAQRAEGTQRPARRHASAPLVTRLNRRVVGLLRAVRVRVGVGPGAAAGAARRAASDALRTVGTAERALPLAVASIVAAASLLAVLPATPEGIVGGAQGSGTDVRLAVGGGSSRLAIDGAGDGGIHGAGLSFSPVRLAEDGAPVPPDAAPYGDASADAGAFLDDGTLLTGYAPDTALADGSGLVVRYRVQSGDTLVSIAAKFGVEMMTVWWANTLASKDAIRVGQVLNVPTVDGLVITVKESDTLASLAAKYGSTAEEIADVNRLDASTLVIGQVLLVPGARGAPIPTPKPVYRSSGGSTSRYTGGTFRWPVVGGGNYISQYYHYGHYAIDIAASHGSPVVAAAAGKVLFAGWKNNGGGWQVWVSHGGNLSTGYFHMSALSVARGQWVARGQQVGRIGSSGYATGPHLHFEVWIGAMYSGGTRVNPLRYY